MAAVAVRLAGEAGVTSCLRVSLTRFDRAAVRALSGLPRHIRTWDPVAREWILWPDPRCGRVLLELLRDRGWRLPDGVEAWARGCLGLPEQGEVALSVDRGTVLVRGFSRESSGTFVPVGIPGATWDRDAKAWRVPTASLPLRELILRLERAGHTLPGWLREELDRASRREAEAAVLSSAAFPSGRTEVAERLSALLPPGLSLYPYQVAAVEFAERAGGRVLIGDQMGLGKTPTAIAWLLLHPEARPVVVFCPALVRLQWVRELQRWAPRETCEVVVSRADVAYLARSGIPAVAEPTGTVAFVVVNYESAARHAEALRRIGPRAVVLDECHWIKDRSAKRTVAVLGVAGAARHVLALSGTPVLNGPAEFYNTLNLLRPGRFGSWWRFAQRYCGLHHNGYGWDASGATNVGELAAVLRGENIMIRRLKSDVLRDLPPKRRLVLHVELDGRACAEVDAAATEVREVLRSPEAWRWLEGMSSAPGSALVAISRLRRALGMAKARAVVPWLLQVSGENRVLVFFHHVAAARATASALRGAGASVALLTGEEPAVSRQASVDTFQRGQVRLLCATYGAAGTGVNLTAADDVVLAEREWVPALEDQAEDRAHRVGRSGVVTVWVVVSDHPVDRMMAEVVDRKRSIVRALVDSRPAGDRVADDAVREFARLLAEETWR